MAPIRWANCDDGFQCAAVLVPLDYDHPAGVKFSLALIRLRASDPAHRLGSLFINPGGPGDSGVGSVRSTGKLYSAAIRSHYDIIGMDPRGIAGSTPLHCFKSSEQGDKATHIPLSPITDREKQEWKRVDRLFAEDCAANAGAILNHMSTANVARDLDLLRKKVGDRKLNYIGFSYGSYLGQTYANMFPANVGAFVIDGVLDPVAWSTGYSRQSRTIPFTTRIRSAEGGEQTLTQYFLLCDRAKEKCAFSGNSSSRFEALAARLQIHPVGFPGYPQLVVDGRTLIGYASGAMRNPDGWIDFAELLAALEAEANTSPYTALTTPSPLVPKTDAETTAAYQQVEGEQGVTCLDTDNPHTYSAWSRAADAAARRFPHFGRYWNWQSSTCLFWPGHDSDRYTGPWTRKTAHPVLVVGNFYDASTPYSGAVAASRLLPGSRLLSYAGWGHRSFDRAGNTCIATAVERYLVLGILPPTGTVCQPVGTPFDVASPPVPRSAMVAPVTSAPFDL